jgi:hypothetical protein
MDSQDNFFADDITSSMKSSPKKIDDFASLKNNTMDFLSNERSEIEKIDAEKPKVGADDFLNFHDDLGDEKPQEDEPVLLPSFEKYGEKIEEPQVIAPEPEIDFHAIEDEYLNPYESSNLKSFKEPSSEKFISSEDLLTDFKDPIPAPSELEVAEPVEEPASKPIVIEKSPVVEPVKPVQEPTKPKSVPPPAPVKQQTSDDTQIEAEKLFKSIGLG